MEHQYPRQFYEVFVLQRKELTMSSAKIVGAALMAIAAAGFVASAVAAKGAICPVDHAKLTQALTASVGVARAQGAGSGHGACGRNRQGQRRDYP
jgi:hypothetical protein